MERPDLTTVTAVLGYISKPALYSVAWLCKMMKFGQFEAKKLQNPAEMLVRYSGSSLESKLQANTMP